MQIETKIKHRNGQSKSTNHTQIQQHNTKHQQQSTQKARASNPKSNYKTKRLKKQNYKNETHSISHFKSKIKLHQQTSHFNIKMNNESNINIKTHIKNSK